jgi:hypothetical protein
MARLPWADFMQAHARPHLVSVHLPKSDNEGSAAVVGWARTGLMRVVRLLGAKGNYSVSVVRITGTPAIHLAFAREEDALALAGALAAKPVEGDPEWASERSCRLDPGDLEAAVSVLSPPRRIG